MWVRIPPPALHRTSRSLPYAGVSGTLARADGYGRGMDVLVVGAHGKVAMRLMKLLADRGDSPRGIIRSTDQASDLEAIGAEPIVLDIENKEIGEAAAGSDAVVFSAGAGAGRRPARKRTVDYGGAVNLAEAAQANDIRRYVIVSALGTNRPERWSDQMRPY